MISLVGITHLIRRWRRPVLRILDDINATFSREGHYVLLGQRDSGMGTLLGILVGTLTPTLGRVDRRCAISPIVNIIARSGGERTGRQLATFLADLYNADAEEVMSATDELSGLPGWRKQILGDLSREHRARLSLSLGYALPCDFYVFGGGVAGGEEKFNERCMQAFAARQRRSGTIVALSKSRNAEHLGSKGAVLYEGKLYMFDSVGDAIETYDRICAVSSVATEKTYHQAIRYSFRREDFRGAMRTAEIALTQFPASPGFHIAMAQVSFKLEQHNEALKHARNVLAIDPDNVHALQIRAEVYQQLQMHREASEIWQHLASLSGSKSAARRAALLLSMADGDPDTSTGNATVETYYYAILRSARRQDYQSAMQTAELAAAQFPDAPEFRVAMVEMMFRLGKRDEALEAAEVAAAQFATAPQFHFAMAETMYRLEQYDESLKHAGNALAVEPDNVQALKVRAEACQQLNLYREAGEAWQQLASLSGNRRVARRAAQLFSMADDGPEPSGGDATVETYYYAILRLSRRQDYQGAMETAERAVTQYPEAPEFRVALAEMMFRLGRRDEALGVAERAAAQFTGAPEFHIPMAEAMFRLEQHDEVLKYADKVLAIDFDNAQALQLRAEACQQLLMYREAGEAWRHLASLSGNRNAARKAAQLLSMSGEEPEPASGMATAEEYYYAIQRSSRRQDYQEALQTAELAVARHPEALEFRVAMAEMLFRLGRREEALEAAQLAAAQFAAVPEFHAAMGEMMVRLGQHDEALKHAANALAVESGNVDALKVRAEACQELKRYREAGEAWQELASLTGNKSAARRAAQLLSMADEEDRGLSPNA